MKFNTEDTNRKTCKHYQYLKGYLKQQVFIKVIKMPSRRLGFIGQVV